MWTLTLLLLYVCGVAYCLAAANDEREGRPLSAMWKFALLWPLMLPIFLLVIARLMWREMR